MLLNRQGSKADWDETMVVALVQPLLAAVPQLAPQEIDGRAQRRIVRLAKAAHLPAGKILANFDTGKLPLHTRRLLEELCRGEFLDRAENLLIFGLSGRGKTHFAAAVGHELVYQGHSVYFTSTYRLVDGLLRAKRDLLLERELRRLDRFELRILDDIGYVQQSPEKIEVLFTLLAERY